MRRQLSQLSRDRIANHIIMNELDSLGIKAVDQTELETTITKQVNEAIQAKDQEIEQKRLDKAQQELKKVRSKIASLERKLQTAKISQRKQIQRDIEWFTENELGPLKQDIEEIRSRIEASGGMGEMGEVGGAMGAMGAVGAVGEMGEATNGGGDRMAGETEREFLIRTGKITAFGTETAFDVTGEESSHVNLRQPGISEYQENDQDYVYDDDSDPVNHNLDDGDEQIYQKRLYNWAHKRSKMRGDPSDDVNVDSEPFKPHPTIPDSKLDDIFKLPGDIYPSLFEYQKTCVQWLWELYNQKSGGILGDEMGLGKTIQVISFIAGLHYSKLLDKPVLVVVPATVLNQWANEFHKWWPPLRCVILHGIGSGMSKKVDEDKYEEFLQQEVGATDELFSKGILSNKINAKAIIDKVVESGHVLITTYVGLRVYKEFLLPQKWAYCILDEGHKIRNPNLDISLVCKQIRTFNRIILSGTPIQNNLIELWSLFDFVFPGRLGTLPIFEQQFAGPIKMGGYANATNVQVQTSYKCATTLRDLISPYLLRRLKHDVAKDLPKKQEMVLFVQLTQYQQDLYESYLKSEDLNSILKGKRNMLLGIDVLRKICNHPDLLLLNKGAVGYGDSSKSGKMEVVKKLIEIWGATNHKILIFCQTRQMLDILERFLQKLVKPQTQETFPYLRMDGTTPIAKRQDLVDQFNSDPHIVIFLLTTKVGGLGVNLTGADRIIIYDPDWNPSTDMQARERAWRLGQKRDIVIYRLMIMGSIEEKIYHRQIFKTFLTNKILKDPKQRKFFKMNDLYDLFTLGDQNEQGTETGAMFDGNESQYQGTKARKRVLHSNQDDFLKVAGIMGVSKLDKFEEEEKTHESELMEGLFKTSVHSKLEHDQIFKDSDSAVDKEVEKIVTKSVEALNESRKLTRRNKIGTPTWTGKFGRAGKFGATKFGSRSKPELSSKNIITNIKRQKGDIVKSNEAGEKDYLLPIIILLFEGDKLLKSTQILLKLKHEVDVKNTRDVLVVKTMLRKVCDWDIQKKVWKLKDLFKDVSEGSGRNAQ